MSVKVRFAPSPTGLLHVGNIRIALLNYLFAKANNGSFVLRIDDTDLERSTKESEDSILEDLAWLGIKWNEFYRQSNHLDQYDAAFEYLKTIGRVYPCYETKEELSLKRKIQTSNGEPPVYDRAALSLSEEQIAKFESDGVKPHWRFKLNDSESANWTDLVHGDIAIPLNSISDPILVKPDGSYVYTFASVVDDINIGITHIIRGDDHVTNTAVQIDLFKAISGRVPQFAHVPLLSAADNQDVSKRTGSKYSIVNMRKDGIEPQAIINFLTCIGTSNNPVASDTVDTLISKFSFDKMSLASPKFNLEDVKLLSRKIIAEKSYDEVKGLFRDLEHFSEFFWNAIKGNISTIKEVITWHNLLFCEILPVDEDQKFVKQMYEVLHDPFSFKEWIAELKNISGRKGRDLFHPIRLVLTGLDKGPELEKIAEMLGYERLKARILNCIKG